MGVQAVQLSNTGFVPNTTGAGLNLSQQLPTFIQIQTSDTLAAVTAAGYLNASHNAFQFPYSNDQMALVSTTDSGTVWLSVSVSGSTYSLVSPSESGTITNPTVTNQIAYASNTSATIAATGLATALFNAGNISAGKSGTAGILESYPAVAANGKLVLAAVGNAGNHTTTISSLSTLGQDEVMTIPDVGAATGQFLVKTAALVSGNFPVNSGTAGLVVDSGIVAAHLVVNTGTTTMAAASKIILDKGTGTEVSNAVTINKQSGVITTTNLSTAAGAAEIITLTNSEVATTSVVSCFVQGGANTTPGITLAWTVTSNTVVITLYNNQAISALNGTVAIGFVVF